MLLRLQYCWYNVWYARSVDAASASRRIVFVQFGIGWLMVERWPTMRELCVSGIVSLLAGDDVCSVLRDWGCG